MKQLSHSLLLFTSFAIVILASCKKSGLQELSQDNPNSNESIACVLTDMGFNTDGMEVFGDYALVEGDIMVRLPNANALSNSGIVGERQYAVSADAVINWANTHEVTYYIHSSVYNVNEGSEWVAAIHTATSEWTNVPKCTLTYVEVTDVNAADLVIVMDNLTNEEATALGIPCQNPPFGIGIAPDNSGKGSFPQNGQHGSWMILQDNFAFGPLTQEEKAIVVRHELGHNIGLKHDSSAAGVSSSCNPANGHVNLVVTPSEDLNSIMHPISFPCISNTDCVWPLSQYDKVAAQTMYPDNCCNVNFLMCSTGNYQSTTPQFTLTFSPQSSLPYYYYEVEMRSNPLGLVIASWEFTGNNTSFTTTYSGPGGNYYFTIKGKNYKKDFVKTGMTTQLKLGPGKLCTG